MKIEIDNITFDFQYSGSDLLGDDENLGLGTIIIPGPMATRFRREVGPQQESGIYLFPHYEEEETRDHMGSEHECYNADTQIVLMSWLFDKQRKYKLDFYGLDPYWLFHDSFHARNDVYRGEVDGIDSHVEYERLLQGAEFAKSKDVYMMPETLAKLDENWSSRWKYRERDNFKRFQSSDFEEFLSPEDYELADLYVSCGTFSPNNRY